MSEKYDVIVIGAGNGGGSAALGLAQQGVRTLLLEKQHIPGGYATTFVRGDYEFEGSLHHLSGLGNKENPGPMYFTLKEMGVIDEIPYLEIPAIRIITGPYDMSLPTGKENFKNALKQHFPEESDGIDRFFELAWNVWDEFQQLFHYNFDLVDVYSRLDLEATKEKYPLFFKYAFRNGMSVLREYFKSPYLMYGFMATSMYSGLFEEISFLDMLIWPIYYFSYPQSHIAGGSQAQSLAIARKFRECGGTLKCGDAVKQILVENGKAIGVLTEKGETFYADTIVTNVHPISTYGDMMDPKDVPAGTIEEYNGRPEGFHFPMVYLGLDCPATELGVNHAIDWIVDPLHMDEKPPLFIASRDPITPNQPSDTGKMDIATAGNAAEWLHTPPELYAQKKYEMADRLISEAEKYFPGIREHIVEMDIATPLTNSRFSGATGGSIGGIYGNFTHHLLYPKDYNNKVEGLYLINTGTNMHNGFQATVTYGYALGKELAKEIVKN